MRASDKERCHKHTQDGSLCALNIDHVNECKSYADLVRHAQKVASNGGLVGFLWQRVADNFAIDAEHDERAAQ